MTALKNEGFRNVMMSKGMLYLIILAWLIGIVGIIWFFMDRNAFPNIIYANIMAVVGCATGFCLGNGRLSAQRYIEREQIQHENKNVPDTT